MVTFLDDVIEDLLDKQVNISEVTFILPNRRAGVFLIRSIARRLNNSVFLPEILSIEEFIETISDLKYANNTELLFQFYKVYISHTPKDLVEPFEVFSKWAQMLLQDFNEIDRYLIPPDDVFDYLNAIKQIEHNHWSLEEQQTDYIKRYLSFWNRLKIYYHELSNVLINDKKGYQGLVYREAVENIEQYTSVKENDRYIFVGFNALNKAEELIIQELLHQDKASIYWDIDEAFLSDPIHDAGLFIRSFKSKWKYFRNNDFNWSTNHFSKEKFIASTGVSKPIGQIKYVGQLLSKLKEEQQSLERTAIILGDESLVLPLLNSLPENIGPINITMGLPLNTIPLASLFDKLFRLHSSKESSLYHKDVISILSHQFIRLLFQTETNNLSDQLITEIKQKNILYLSADRLNKTIKTNTKVIEVLFGKWNNDPSEAIKSFKELIYLIKSCLDHNKTQNALTLEYLYRFNTVFNELSKLNDDFGYINSITTLYGVYKEVVKNESLDFKGEPLKGLQVMGMLESRVLDFETVIIISVNEGILPAGKGHNSFIPFDVKLQNEIPTYKEKDAVYTYHFYRLIQRAKRVHLIYNTEPDVLKGGEPSRFLTQLDIDPTHQITHQLASPVIRSADQQLLEVTKTPDIIKTLKSLAQSGFSPSSLSSYIRDPMAFYNERILGISQYEDVEDNVAYNTLGTIIHNTLEDLYKPFENEFLTSTILKSMKEKASSLILHHFKSEYKEGDISRGKNLIVFEIVKHYVSHFLEMELKALKEGNSIQILAIETHNKVPIEIDGLDFPIILSGKVDRVDKYNGTTRIIDYKSGRVDSSKVEIINWEEITTEYDKFSKSFQLLMYAYMMTKNQNISLPLEAGIISFKNLGKGLLKFGKKESARSRSKNHSIDEETLENFEKELKALILEIFDPEIKFKEKETEQ